MDNEDKLFLATEYVAWFNGQKDLVHSEMLIDIFMEHIYGAICKFRLSDFKDTESTVQLRNESGAYEKDINIKECIDIYRTNNWISITDKLPKTEQKVRVLILNKYNQFFIEGLATYIYKHSILAEDFLSEDVDDGTEYTPEGFYDFNITAEADSFLLDDVVYWQPIVNDYPKFKN